MNFALSKGGEAIGLFAADGTAISTVTFGAQTSDVSQGRATDGSTNIVFMNVPTPRTNNIYNTPPVLAAINNVILTLGQTVAFTANATDADVPAQTLAFSLGAGAPVGASITTGGQFTWTPTNAPRTNSINVIVTDNGTPPASATRAFTVTVNPLPQLTGAGVNAGQFVLSWSTSVGQNYQVEYKNNLTAPVWTPLGSPVPGTGGLLTMTNDMNSSLQCFFRIKVQ